MLPRCAPDGRVAVLSFHSHGDRSFLDDRELALISGDLTQRGIANDLVVTVLGDGADDETERRLARALESYDPIVFERVWSPELIQRLRERLPGRTFVSLWGEHRMPDAPADVALEGQLRVRTPVLVDALRSGGASPAGTLVRQGDEWVALQSLGAPAHREPRYAPNLRPVVVNPEKLPDARTFSITGNVGCPYQNDARDNPVYAGVHIPAGYGRGCAFCVTGNNYEGRPNTETAASVLEQLRYVRENAPELDLFVLKDQNPFGYLTEVVESCAVGGLGDFSLLLETRADWFLRNQKRFERALAVAREARIRIAPFLVGIESFSQPELDRFNKGTRAEANEAFLEALWRWQAEYGEAMDLSHASFGFILFSPWTTLEDLATNLAAIRRTRFHKLRGSVLLSRARLYPDTALYYLAEKDGLLAEEFDSAAADSSKRYGYYPYRPWRFRHPEVRHFAELAVEVSERRGSRDQIDFLDALVRLFEDRGGEWKSITIDEVVEERDRAAALGGAVPPKVVREVREKLERMLAPLRIGEIFAEGWRIADVSVAPGRLIVKLEHDVEATLEIELVPRGDGPHFVRSKHYDLSIRGKQTSPSQLRAAEAVCDAIRRNDR